MYGRPLEVNGEDYGRVVKGRFRGGEPGSGITARSIREKNRRVEVIRGGVAEQVVACAYHNADWTELFGNKSGDFWGYGGQSGGAVPREVRQEAESLRPIFVVNPVGGGRG